MPHISVFSPRVNWENTAARNPRSVSRQLGTRYHKYAKMFRKLLKLFSERHSYKQFAERHFHNLLRFAERYFSSFSANVNPNTAPRWAKKTDVSSLSLISSKFFILRWQIFKLNGLPQFFLDITLFHLAFNSAMS